MNDWPLYYSQREYISVDGFANINSFSMWVYHDSLSYYVSQQIHEVTLLKIYYYYEFLMLFIIQKISL